MKRYTIDPITRLEGHGKIEIFCNDDGDVDNVYFQVPELRGFEKFLEGRPVEENSQIVTKICGVCPGCHHMASGKAIDAVYGVEPPPELAPTRGPTQSHPVTRRWNPYSLSAPSYTRVCMSENRYQYGFSVNTCQVTPPDFRLRLVHRTGKRTTCRSGRGLYFRAVHR